MEFARFNFVLCVIAFSLLAVGLQIISLQVKHEAVVERTVPERILKQIYRALGHDDIDHIVTLEHHVSIDSSIENNQRRHQYYKVRNVDFKQFPFQQNATEEAYQTCMESLKPLLLSKSVQTNSNTTHEKLRVDISTLAIKASCQSSRIWWIQGIPHFLGGRQQYMRYMNLRGWKRISASVPLSELPPSTVIRILSCYSNFSSDQLQQGNGGNLRLISMVPMELQFTSKYPFFISTKTLFDKNNCDYRRFYPETHVVNSQETCLQLVDHIKKENNPERIWFLKLPIESFGRGIAVRKANEALANELSSCEQFGTSSTNSSSGRILFQHGVENILKYAGRYTQGRAYILISNYRRNASTAWFFMGYFNVAAIMPLMTSNNNNGTGTDNNERHDDMDSGNNTVSDQSRRPLVNKYTRAAHVTNLRSNQQSKRLFFHQLLEGRTPKDMSLIYHHIKRAALTSFLALKPSLERHAADGSFSLIGFDYLIQTNLQVKVLETNCNCELFFDPSKFGKERVMSSTMLMDGMMDIVLASNLNPQEFGELLKKHLEADVENRLKDPREAVWADGGRYPGLGSWELIYSEAIEPVFQYTDVFADGVC